MTFGDIGYPSNKFFGIGNPDPGPDVHFFVVIALRFDCHQRSAFTLENTVVLIIQCEFEERTSIPGPFCNGLHDKFRCLGIGMDQSACSQQCTSEIPDDYAYEIGQTGPFENVKDRFACGT